MKTSVVMEREMFGFKVPQRTKDGMFNATFLVKQWNDVKTKGRKDVSDFLRNKKVIEFMNALAKEENIDTRNLVSIHRGKNQGTWMNPYLFTKFAMWIDPKFEVKVIKFVHDQLIENRHGAGDNYKMLSNSGAKLKGYNYATVATALQWIVFGKTGKNQRQTATQEQLKELKDIQLKLSYAIDMGFITNFQQLIEQLRTLYEIKYNGFKVVLN